MSLYLFEEQSIITVEEDNQHYQGQDVGSVEAYPFGEGHTFAGVCFFDEVIPAPAVTTGTESKVDQAAQGQQVVADEEVFQVEDAGAFAQRLETAPEVETEYAGQGKQDDHYDIETDGLLTIPAGQVADAGSDIFKYGDNRRHSRKQHEQEEESAPETAAGHFVKYVRQSDKKQVGAAARVDAEAEAGREDNKAGSDGYESIKRHNPHCFTGQTLFFADVAAEDCQRADAKAQGKEGLPHSSKDYFGNAVFNNFAEIRIQVVSETLAAVGQHDGVGCQNQHQYQQAGHHGFGDAFNACFNAQVADTEAGQDDKNHIACHGYRVRQQGDEDIGNAVSIQTYKVADSHFVEIVQHPAGNRSVEHHQDDVAGNSAVFVQMPFRAFRLQYVKRFGCTADAGTAYGKFSYHDGQSQEQQEAQIDKYERSAAVQTGNVRETPYVAQADGAACRDQDKSKPR